MHVFRLVIWVTNSIIVLLHYSLDAGVPNLISRLTLKISNLTIYYSKNSSRWLEYCFSFLHQLLRCYGGINEQESLFKKKKKKKDIFSQIFIVNSMVPCPFKINPWPKELDTSSGAHH